MNFSFMHKHSVVLLRLTLGIIYFWFGLLQLFNASPIQGAATVIFPSAEQAELILFLSAFLEILIGAALLANRFTKIAVIVMIGYLLIEMVAVLVTQGFTPRFPILSLAGEFALKNLVLIVGGFILLAEKQEKPSLHLKEGSESDYIS